jgi:hypothetical protein
MIKGLSKLKNLFWYSDSEPSEITISVFNLIALPCLIIREFEEPSAILIMLSLMCGVFQIWAVLWSDSLNYRLIAVQTASLLSVAVLVNLYMDNCLGSSNVTWFIVCVLTFWNTIRVFNEKIEKGL